MSWHRSDSADQHVQLSLLVLQNGVEVVEAAVIYDLPGVKKRLQLQANYPIRDR